MSDGAHNAREDWAGPLQQLTDSAWKFRPQIVAFGFGEAETAALGKIASRYAFMANGTDTAGQVREIIATLIGSIKTTSGSLRSGDGGLLIEADPKRFTPCPSRKSDRARRDMSATQPAASPGGHVVRPEPPTEAPVVGDVLDTFVSRLDGKNPLRLPSVIADAGALGPFWLAAASCAGLSHLHKATTGQDSYSFALAEDEGAVVLAVADGLGSRPASAQIGATTLARSFCSSLARQSSSAVSRAPVRAMRQSVVAANDSLRAVRERAFPDLVDEDLSSTLGFCWIPVNRRRRKALAGRIGDCAVFTLEGTSYEAAFGRGDGPLNVVGGCLPGTRPAEAMELQMLDLSAVDAVALTTDGLADDIFSLPAVRSWLAECWAEPCGALRMLDALRYRRRGYHDDRTAVVVWPGAVDERGAAGRPPRRTRGG